MQVCSAATLLAAVFAVTAIPATAAPPPIEAFARMPQIRGVTISPDGSRVAYITSSGDLSVAVTLDLTAAEAKSTPLLRSESGEYDIRWCNWANDQRLLCGLWGMAEESGRVYPFTRLVAVNADGSKLKQLIQNAETGRAQFHDHILDWTPDEPDTVLIQLDDDVNGFPTVFELNINTGMRKTHTRERAPIRSFTTDAKGNVRLGSGYSTTSTDVSYYARLENEREWRLLSKIKAFSQTDALRPIAAAPGKNIAYATGDFEGRAALWEMDLTDQRAPQLVFSHPLVDADNPLLTPDGRLLGIWYELDRPFVHYTDEKVRSLIQAINKAEPSKFSHITDSSRDESKFIVRSYSDVDASTYFVLDTTKGRLMRLGTQYPDLDPASQGRMRSIAYKAADGTEIPGYLTVPPGLRAENLPLIVMPHGGPIARDTWDFDFLRAFLVSRGYAVLQMNFRGSSGYGDNWYHAAHQDWGGLTYSDITDGARWAVSQGIADPKRMCVVGWSFGGYAALVGAVRNNDLYRCSVSIAGVADLNQLLSETRFFSNWRFAREQIGVDKEKLRADSPLRQVDKIAMPVLLVHGDKDYQVEVDHTRRMDAALKRANKPHRAVYLKDATHQLDRQSDRVTLLTEIEKFLLENLGPGTVANGS
ncbi:MAG TPA: S9 family peptidase [Povalibacter sp.]|uniref:alpha/beta hydrolase family protein n=1 Tax=Povalibacter sp. TaxID=1962978 RepID=UPI002C24E4E0|nr:S9 family peptidase [Povalibacter sp.]HMN44899.1 S9 family peptidase [Povalibacter sp.]